MAARLPDLLFRLLAEGDAPFFPLRKSHWLRFERVTVTAEARRTFRASGVPWASREKSEAARKQSQRDLESLAEAGHVHLTRRRRKVISVRLSDRAEAVARRMIGCGNEYTASMAMMEIAKRSKRKMAKDILDLLVSETTFSGESFAELPYDAPGVSIHDYHATTHMLLWALTRDLVRTGSDHEGRAYYLLTQQGWAKLDGDWDPRVEDGEPTEEAADIYFDALADAASRLDAAEPNDPSDLGMIAITCSPVGVRTLCLASTP